MTTRSFRCGAPPPLGRAAVLLAAWVLAVAACSEPPAPADGSAPAETGVDARIAAALSKLGDDPGLYPVRVELGAAYLDRARASGDWQDVLRAEEHLVRAQETQATEEGLRHLASLRLFQHRFREAESAARQALDAWPQDGAARSVLGDALLAQGRVDEARDVYLAFASDEPDFASYAGSAHCRFQTGDVDGAREDLGRALALLDRLPPDAGVRHARAWTLLMRGSFAFEAGDAERARADYAEALAIEPGSADVQEHMAEWEALHGDLDEAIRRYEALVTWTSRPDIVAALGEALRRAGRTAEGDRRLHEAEALWRKRLAAGDGGARRALALYLLDHGGDTEEALVLARADLESREDALAYDTLAWALHRLGRHREARDALAHVPAAHPLRVLREHRQAILRTDED